MMKKFVLYHLMGLLLLGGLSWGCQDDSYYERPSTLEPPIYEQLKLRGNFSNYLKCVDEAGMQQILNAAGYYTVFAPNDSAFAKFFREKGFGSLDEVSLDVKKQLVSYSLTVVPATKDLIDDYQESKTAAIVKNSAYKRMSFYYNWVHEDSVWYEEKGVRVRKKLDLVDMNAVEAEPRIPGSFEVTDYNRKHIPFFTDNYMAAKNLSAVDYNYFYPTISLGEFNVVDAHVVKQDQWAENGIIHEVDKVILPLDNIDEVLSKTPECNEFREILEKYQTSYTLAPADYLLKYEQASGGVSKDLYIKDFPYLNFALNCENYLRYGGGSDMDAYNEGWTLFAPTDAAMQAFYSEKLFKYGYTKLEDLPDFVLQEFVNAHMFRKTVWPTKFSITTNYTGEEARFNAGAAPGTDSDVLKAYLGSNGIFYAVKKVQDADVFRTVLGDVILSPNYSMMYQAIQDCPPFDQTLKNPLGNFRLFLINNAQFEAAGFEYNAAADKWVFNDVTTRPDLGSSAPEALTRFINLHVVLVTAEMENAGFDMRTTTGIVQTYNGEFIKYANGVVYASGNPTTARPSISQTIDSEPVNGESYALTRPILFSVENVGAWLTLNSLTTANRATILMNYLTKAATATYKLDGVTYTIPSANAAYNPTNKTLKDISSAEPITVFLPNDPAMNLAVTNGVLPSISSFAPSGLEGPTTLVEDNRKIENFTKYHIIKGNLIVGGADTRTYTTYYKLDDGTYATLSVTGVAGNPGELSITDHKGRTAKVRIANTATYNILGNRCIVHLIDNYLTY